MSYIEYERHASYRMEIKIYVRHNIKMLLWLTAVADLGPVVCQVEPLWIGLVAGASSLQCAEVYCPDGGGCFHQGMPFDTRWWTWPIVVFRWVLHVIHMKARI